ncbi:hypothetical protein QYE76_048713 [Lolium multiflorum]|uniref:Uncharacterized protein n=1 Tax=Lolium multiflorum TaxID=4521 RepID=A0AAD8SMV8_LOLMU|nr:hypothetical protein QYE76_048713 [Lolium multiflorum]
MGESWMVDGEASVMVMAMISSNSPSRQGARTEFLVLDWGFWWRRSSGTLSGKTSNPGIFRSGLYSAKERSRGWPRRPDHPWARPSLVCGEGWCGPLVAPLRLVFWLRESSGIMVNEAGSSDGSAPPAPIFFFLSLLRHISTMPPRTKLYKNIAPSTGERVEKEKISGWERSKISSQDKRMLKSLGLLNKEAMQMPGDECTPLPPSGFRDHQTLSSLPPLPEGGDVSERAVITDDSQETSVRESEPAESEKSAGSSDKVSESGQASDSSHPNSPPPAASPDKRKRKRNPDEEDSGASKLSEPATVESSPEEEENFNPFTATGNPLMKEMVDIGSCFIGFRDEAESLREALRRAEERANDLEKKRKASEKVCKKAEKEAADVEDLRQTLEAAEDALSDKESKLV